MSQQKDQATSGNSRKPPIDLNDVMQCDRFRLQQQWRKVVGRGSEAEASWTEKARTSAARVQQRIESLPELSFDDQLPISGHREQIVELLRNRQVIVVCGETGSGKSTQLPKLCLDAGLGARGIIGHTQPRRLAARAVAGRLAEETAPDLVGHKIRFSDSTSPKTLIKLMTDGILLAETQSDRFLDQYSAIIIDEAHERSLNIDFLMGILKKISAKRPDLRIIITSATIDPEKFANHFCDEEGPAPIVEVSGRSYPVEVRYRQPEESDLDESVPLRAITEAVEELWEEAPGDVLTFLPTERDIRITAKHLRGHFTNQGIEKSVEILPLYARLSQAEQNKIFGKHSRRRIVLATNVAESSLTVPGIRYVVDTGLVRISRYAPRSRVQRLPIESISQASANQRSGRCGRLGPGICIRLYDEEDFRSRAKFTTPEIRRSNLASVLLQSLVLKLGDLESFPLLDPPTPESLRDGERTLQELGAVDDNKRLTTVGRQLGKLPCDPRVGRMLIEASQRRCLADVLIIAAALECQDVRQRPSGKQSQADEEHGRFQDPHSDFLSYLRLWDHYEKLKSNLGRSRLQKALGRGFLSYQGFREWSDVVRQLRQLLSAAGITMSGSRQPLPPVPPPEESDSSAAGGNRKRRTERPPQAKIERPKGYAAIHQSLLAGLLSGIGVRGDRHEYQAARGLTVSLWPGSGLFQRQPKWIMAGEVVETSKRFARTVAEIDVDWIEAASGSLLKHSYNDPHWSSKTGSAMVYRKSTLFGLTIVPGRRVPLAPLDRATARTLMIEHGLVGDEWNCTERFYRQNQELLADIDELVQRTRSRDYILDRFHLQAFYEQRVPEHVYDLNSLRKWLKEYGAGQTLLMSPDDLLKHSESKDIAHDYPNDLQVGDTVLPLRYHFEPGHEQDGVTVTVPQAALRQVSEEALGWVVPGLLEEKILAVIRALPKSLRTNFVPAPDVAKKLAIQLGDADRSQPFSNALAQVMQEHSGERVAATNLDPGTLPQHLRFLVQVIDADGKVLGQGRSVAELQDRFALPIESDEQAVAYESDWENREITPTDFPELPESVRIRQGGVAVAAYPALVDLGDKVEARLADTAAEAESLSKRGLTRLLAVKLAKSVRNQVKHLPGLNQCGIQLAGCLSAADLKPALSDMLVRMALVEDQPPVRDGDALNDRCLDATVKLSIAAQEVALWLPKFAESYHRLRLALEKAPATWAEVTDQIQEQMDALMPANFLRETQWFGLSEYPRYLKAIEQRLDKMKQGGLPKDRRLRAPIDAVWNDYLELCEQNEHRKAAGIEQLRWMIEEFRVSTFAQSLGTKQTVSEKRIRERIAVLAE